MHFGNFGSEPDTHNDYFQRPPERLVLEGYRRWFAGFKTGSIVPWEMAWDLFAATLGVKGGRQALGELAYYVRTLQTCAQCPLQVFPFNSGHVCLDECLTLGLIAGLQNDPRLADVCLLNIACPARCAEVEIAATSFAETLMALRARLLPIPVDAIEDVVARARRTGARRGHASKNLH